MFPAGLFPPSLFPSGLFAGVGTTPPPPPAVVPPVVWAAADLPGTLAIVCDFGEADADAMLGPVHVRSCERLEVEVLKDDLPWDVDSLAFAFKAPSGSEFLRDAELASGTTWGYDVPADDLGEAGRWRLGVRVEDGAVSDRWPRKVVLWVTDPLGETGGASGVPAAALLDEGGTPLWDESGEYLTGDA